MKIRPLVLLSILASLSIVDTALAQRVPVPPAPQVGWIVDQVDILSPEQEADINAVVNALDTDLQTQFAVLTMDDCGPSITELRTQVFRTWGVGHDKTDRGLLILVCMYSKEPKRRTIGQEVGYGLEGDIPDITTVHYRQDYFMPFAKKGEFGAGIVSMVHAYNDLLREVIPAIEEAEPYHYSPLMKLLVIILILIVIAGLLYLVFVISGSSSSGY
ncbi:TPM domain-containing protein, partial [Candidatus Woesebacteria bacterium]|nr:TPM domain-containing protein [Candidatus Woesebacteria bacterium]